MKITVKHNGTSISVEEAGTHNPDKLSTMRYSDQNSYIQSTIKVMCEQVIKLSKNDSKTTAVITPKAQEKLAYILGSGVTTDFPKQTPSIEWAGVVLDLLEELDLLNS